MTISAKVVLDSLSPYDDTRLTTLEVRFPRFILAEFNTHRAFSRSSASSRAIPTPRLLQSATFVPEFTVAGKGMASNSPAPYPRLSTLVWNVMRWVVVAGVWLLHRLKVHKQHANRPLEPFLWHTVLVSSTEWQNFLMQRDHPAAQPEMQCLARSIGDALRSSRPVIRKAHLPYVDPAYVTIGDVFVSVGRCATVSYDNLGQGVNVDNDFARAEKLKGAEPPHYSPAEHVAYACEGRWANFDGWKQERRYWERGYR